MKTFAIVLVAAACGPIYPQQPAPTAGAAQPVEANGAPSSGPPGGAMDPQGGYAGYAPAGSPNGDPTNAGGAPTPYDDDARDPRGGADRPDPRGVDRDGDAGDAAEDARAGGKPGSAAEVFVREHNRYRAKHCAQPLSWSPQLAADAQKWADTLKAKGCMFGHSGGKHGENLAAGTTGAVPPEEVVRMWYDEVKLYDFKKPTGFSMETGHFTQVVWLDTTQVGCGMVQCKGNDIWVCQYESPGNWEGQFRQKVLPASCKK